MRLIRRAAGCVASERSARHANTVLDLDDALHLACGVDRDRDLFVVGHGAGQRDVPFAPFVGATVAADAVERAVDWARVLVLNAASIATTAMHRQ